MATRTVIIHGWSDCSDSFAAIKKYLTDNGVGDVSTIYYADYESREDNLTFDDIADGLTDEFIRLGFIDDEGNALVDLNVVVHSTGGLVIRHWISRYYMSSKKRLDACPVKRIVMLAPANFGSPLAHRGKSFLGELFKGRWRIGDFLEVGRQLLDGLELGSPYQWHLAHADLLSGLVPYSADRIQLTILVGIKDYAGMRGWVNKPGTDGTVVISGTTLNALKLTLDCTRGRREGDEYSPYQWSEQRAVDEFAWGVLPGLDHGSIVDDVKNKDGGVVGPIMLAAFKAKTPEAFRALCDKTEAITEAAYAGSRTPKYQQFAVHAVDDLDNSIADFTLEFFVLKASRATGGTTREGKLTSAELDYTERASALILGQAHQHTVDPSYRRFLVDVSAIKALLVEASGPDGLDEPVTLSMRVYVPRVDSGIFYAVDQLQNVVLVDTSAKSKGPSFLFENTTTMLELRVNRSNTYVTVGTKPREH
jgi:hypothetical protein